MRKHFKSILILSTLMLVFLFSFYGKFLISPNSYLIGTEGDAMKNYYTYQYLIKNNKYITYANSPFAYVETNAETELQGFIQQRLRWSAKVKYYKNWKMILPSMLFTVWSLSIYLPLIITLWYPVWMSGVLMVLKLCIDYVVVDRFYKNFERKFRLIDFITLTVVYPIYVIYIGIISFFKTFTWKKRQAKV